MTDAKPYPKAQQLGRAERRYRRGPCRVCEIASPVEFHHVVPRDLGGDDVADNIVPLCSVHHQLVTVLYSTHTRFYVTHIFVASLTDAEYAYAVEKVGENVWERVYGIEYGR